MQPEKSEIPQMLPLEIQKTKPFTFLRCDPKDPDIEYLKAYFGLNDDFDPRQLICSDPGMNKLSFISRELSDFLYTDCMAH